MITFKLLNKNYECIDKVKYIFAGEAKYESAKQYFRSKGFKGKFILFNTMSNKFKNVRIGEN